MKKNKLKLLFPMLCLGLVIFSSCGEDDLIASLDGIELSQESLLLNVEEVSVVTVSADLAGDVPEGTATERLTWASSDPSIAIVQANDAGLVASIQGLTLGTATLTASNTAGTIMKSLNVEVIVKVESIELEEVPIASDAETSYTVLFTPESTTKKAITWTSSDPSIATVDANGKVTAVQAGPDGAPVQVIITATSEEGGKTASIELTVSEDPAIIGIIYCSVSGNGGYNTETLVTTGADADLDYAGAQPNGNYEYVEDQLLVVQPGSGFDLLVTHSNTWSRTVVWIDWNGDMDFADEGELVQTFGDQAVSNGGTFAAATINVPSDATPGTWRMRVLTGDAWTTPDDDGDNADNEEVASCGEVANGTYKDFNIQIGGVVYCAATGGGGYNVESLSTAGGSTNIDYTGDQPNGNYERYTGETLSVAAGGSFDLSLSQANGWSRTIVWIDWNADGDFEDADERVAVFGNEQDAANQLAYNTTINVPAGATQGNVRMRVLSGDAWTYTDTDAANLIPDNPCGDLANSTTKDFNVAVQ